VVLAAAAFWDVVEAVDVEVILAVLKLDESELEVLVVLGLVRLREELEEVDVSEVASSFDVFVDFEDFEDFESELVLASGGGGEVVGVGAALLLSSKPSPMVAVIRPRSIVISLRWKCIGNGRDILSRIKAGFGNVNGSLRDSAVVRNLRRF
jgi:hypothetical protein